MVVRKERRRSCGFGRSPDQCGEQVRGRYSVTRCIQGLWVSVGAGRASLTGRTRARGERVEGFLRAGAAPLVRRRRNSVRIILRMSARRCTLLRRIR